MSTILPINYATVEDVLITLPAIGSVTNITSQTIAHFIGKVEAEMNARLATSYAVPLPSGSHLLTAISTDLTIHEILGKRIFTQDTKKDGVWADRYKQSHKLLLEIAAGKVPVVNSAGAIVQTLSTGGGTVWSNNMDYSPTFAEDDFTSSFQDEDKMDDIDDNRD